MKYMTWTFLYVLLFYFLCCFHLKLLIRFPDSSFSYFRMHICQLFDCQVLIQIIFIFFGNCSLEMFIYKLRFVDRLGAVQLWCPSRGVSRVWGVWITFSDIFSGFFQKNRGEYAQKCIHPKMILLDLSPPEF